MLVVDASITLAWVLVDETTPFTDSIRRRVLDEGAMVPSIWTLEVANALVVAERRGRQSAAAVTRALAALQQLPITVLSGSLGDDLNVVASTARDHNLTAYDAAYLSLARQHAVPLATLDTQLVSAALRVGVEVLTDSASD